MDAATFIGLIGGLLSIIWAVSQGRAGLAAFLHFPSFLITVGGTVAAVVMSFSLSQLAKVARVTRIAFTSKEPDALETINNIVKLAERARREGLLALDDSLSQVKDEFLKRGMQLVVDGTDPEIVRDILQTELTYVEDRHKAGKKVFDAIAVFAPAFGMVGTLIGLIQMLKNIEDPSSIGPSMAVALVTTLYGALIANLVAIPIGNKLAVKSMNEVKSKEMILEGILSIQSGENPRIVEEKLKGFLTPQERGVAMQRQEDAKKQAGKATPKEARGRA